MEEKISALIAAAEEKLAPAFKRLEAIEEIGTRRVLAAFQEHQVAYRHFARRSGGNGGTRRRSRACRGGSSRRACGKR